MTMHKAIHPRDDVDGHYASRKEGRGHAGFEDRVDVSVWRLEDYIKKSQERLITVTRNCTDFIKFNRKTITSKHK